MKNKIFSGLLFGFSLGHLLNARYAVILLDRLGNEFEISRNAKQAIFTKRKDLNNIEKAEIFSAHKQQVDNQVDSLISNTNI